MRGSDLDLTLTQSTLQNPRRNRYQGDEFIVAMRDIAVGEHLAYDYAFTETEGSLHVGLLCRCGAAACRGVLTFDDWRSPQWRAKYRGYVRLCASHGKVGGAGSMRIHFFLHTHTHNYVFNHHRPGT